MNKFRLPVLCGTIGAVFGVVAAEFFPNLLKHFLSGLNMFSINNPFSQPFDSARNEMALKYGLVFLALGAVIGFIIMLIPVKKRRKR